MGEGGYRMRAVLMRAALRAIATAAILSSLSLASAQSPPPQPQNQFDGVWTGSIEQAGAQPYRVLLTIGANGFFTQYPELNCNGRLSPVGASGEFAFFTETIEQGRADSGGSCVDGSITLAITGDRIAYGWFGVYQGELLQARGALGKQ